MAVSNFWQIFDFQTGIFWKLVHLEKNVSVISFRFLKKKTKKRKLSNRRQKQKSLLIFKIAYFNYFIWWVFHYKSMATFAGLGNVLRQHLF